MRSRWTGVLALVVAITNTGDVRAQSMGMEEVSGLYTVTAVNQKALPAATWKREASDTTCATATQQGTLMMDSNGRWALFVTERDRCTRGTRRWTAKDVSTLSTGTYTVGDDTITLTDAASGGTYRATLVQNRLTITISGSDPFGGQTATYVLRRQRAVRAKG